MIKFRPVSIYSLAMIMLTFGGYPQEASAETVYQTVKFQFEIKPILSITLGDAGGGQHIDFGNVLPDLAIPDKEISVSVATNTGNSYRIYQTLESEISNQAGVNAEAEDILFRVSNGKNKGISGVMDFSPLTTEESVIFNSSSKGGSDSFTISYKFVNSKIYKAGQYLGRVRLWMVSDE